MMNLLTHWNRIRWNQLNELEDLQHSLRSLFSRSCGHGPEEHAGVAQWIPLVDVSEDATRYVLRVELPRVKPADVKLNLEEGTLLITGDRKFDQNGKKDHQVEHAYGRFAHSFVLPADARPAKVRSAFKNGVLIVHLAKNGCGLDAVRVYTSLFPQTRTAKKNKNENETAIIPR